jgi:biopolymer transport protein ExbD
MLLKVTEQDEGVAIDMTPVIDMVFMLLTFFLVATTFQQEEREMNIALPFASNTTPVSAMLQEFIVNVDRDGRIIVGGRTVEAEQLRSMVAEAVAANAQQKVTVRGDRAAAYASVVGVLDICKGAGVQQPYLDTVLTK